MRHIVEQRENRDGFGALGTLGTYWFVVRSANSQTVLASETYTRRSSAVRAARRYIESITPAPVKFTYWTAKGRVTEEIR